MIIYIVRRPFKSRGLAYAAGQVITDPASIKLFKSKVHEGKVIAFNRNDKTTVSRIKWLEKKLGVSIIPGVKAYLAEVDAAKQQEEKAEDVVNEDVVNEDVVNEDVVNEDVVNEDVVEESKEV